jgi:hypothetical protein
MGRWRRFWQLEPPARGYLVEALLLLPIVRLVMGLLGFGRCQRLLNRLVPGSVFPANLSTEILEKSRRVACMVRAASIYGLFRATCLPQSLTLWWMLRRRRIPVEIFIGVRKDDQRLEAHAWVELCGTVLNDSDDVHQRFAAFDGSVSQVRAELP